MRVSLAVLLAVIVASCGGSSSPGPSTVPTVTSIAPGSGSTLGGTTVTIAGTHFAAGATVTIGGVAATSVVIQSETTIQAVTGPHAAGAADVTVNVSGTAASLAGAFTYALPGVNAPPTITAFVATGSRPKEPAQYSNVGEAIALTATVTDAETPVDKLTFQWSASAGTITGTGPSVTWTAPATHGTVIVKLTVVEQYQGADDAGLPVAKENRTEAQMAIDVHEERKEISDMAGQFLIDFSNSSQTNPDYILRNFLGSCGNPGAGEDDERRDIINNRATRTITSSSVGIASVTVNFDTSCAFHAPRFADSCTSVPVEWHSLILSGAEAGKTEDTKGIDWVTASYDAPTKRWWLCDSDFDGTITTASSGAVRQKFGATP